MSSDTFDLSATIREVRRTGGTRGVLMRRTFPATARQLWAACTQAEPLARWIGRLETDAGTYRLVMGSTGKYIASCEVLRCEAPNRLELIWSFPHEEPSVVRATITEVDAGAELTIEHLALTAPDGLGYGAGWEEYLADLGEYLDGRTERGHDCDALERQAGTIWEQQPVSVDDSWGSLDEQHCRLIRVFANPPRQVWDAITTAPGLSWFGRLTPDQPEIGTQWTVAFSDGSAHGTVLECSPYRFTTTFTQDADPEAEHVVRVALSAVDGGTQLILEHTYAAGTPAKRRQGLASGWYAHLAVLGRILESGTADEDGWLADYRMALLVHR